MGRKLNKILTGTALTHPIQQRDPVTLGIIASSAFASVNMALPTLAAIISSFNVTGFLIRAAIGVALALVSKSKGGDSGASSKTNVRQSIGDRVVIYGQTKVGGTIVYAETTGGNRYMHLVIAVAGHEVEEIGDMYAGDDLLTIDGSGNVTAPSQYVGALRIKKHLGTTTQVADTDLVAESNGLWTSAHRLYETAYIYVRLKFSANAFPNGLPTFTAVVKGKKVYDPRTTLTAWSDNPALCLYDYVTWKRGLAAPTSRMDDVTFSAAANICDESVALSAGGTESRYTLNGAFTTGVTPRSVLSQMMTSFGGTLFYSQGKWRTKAAAWTAPITTLTDDDVRSNYNIVTRHSRRDNFNIVRGTFRGASTNYQDTDYPQVKSATFVTEDGGFESAVDLHLPFTDSDTMAQRLAKIALYRNREQLTVTATFSIEALAIQTGENIYITSDEMGWSAKSFEVVLWSFGIQDSDIVVDMTLREVSSGVFDWSAEEAAFLTNNTTLPTAWVTSPASISISDKLLSINEKVVGVMTIIVTSSDAGFVTSFEVEARKSSDTEWTNLGIASGARFDMLDVEDGLYDVRARTINTFGVRGDWTQINDYQVAAFAAPPDNVSNFQINVVDGIAHLTWDAIADLDLSSYIIRHSPVMTDAAYTASQTVAQKVPRPATSIALPYRSGTYFIKAKDKIGNESVSASLITTNVGEIEGLNAIQTITESTDYAGTHVGVSRTSAGLIIDDLSVTAPSGEYLFDTVFDLGAKYTSRIESQIEFYRVDTSGALFDDTAGLFDDTAGLFDGPDYSDVDVKMQVALTDDDPTGTPTWSAWIDFFAGDFSARGLKFKALLSSTSSGVTPCVTSLAAKIDMPDRVDKGSNIVSGAAPYSVTYSPAFKAEPALGLSVQGMQTGDYYDTTSKTATGFTIEFKNSLGATVSRTFDYVATGYGKVI